jgi:hypothetical protein
VGALSDAMAAFEGQMGALRASYEERLVALGAEVAAEERERELAVRGARGLQRPAALPLALQPAAVLLPRVSPGA